MENTQSNAKELANRFYNDSINQHNTQVLDEIMAPNFKSNDFPQPDANKEVFAMGMKALFNAFPNMKCVVEDQAVSGNKVFTRGYWSGKHTGEFQGIPATNKDVQVKFQDVWKEENGKLVENWVTMDILSLMQQLGAIPAK